MASTLILGNGDMAGAIGGFLSRASVSPAGKRGSTITAKCTSTPHPNLAMVYLIENRGPMNFSSEHHGSLTDRLSATMRESAAGRRLREALTDLRGRSAPLHWSNLFGVVSMACLVILFVTGVFLMFGYDASSAPVTYAGSYPPLVGIEMSAAYASTLYLSFEVPGGLLMRQAHHWAGLLLPAAIILQILVNFFTGAFRRPRRGSWVLLFLVFAMALASGWSGYALPDDLLSGTGLRIAEGIALGIPFVGTALSNLVFSGAFPGRIIENLYPLHVFVFPAVLVLFLILRIRSGYRHGAPQFAGPGRSEQNIVGIPFFPQMAMRVGGLFLVVSGLIMAISATVTIAPIWLYGPSSPGDASAGSQPDWYTGFLDGALRLVPPGWEVEWLGRTWTLAVLVPLTVVALFLLLVVSYPFLEEWITGDNRNHHLLDRPRNAPGRTAIGVAAIVFYGALWGAASADLLATVFAIGLEQTIQFFQVTVLLGPMIAFVLTRRIAIGLQRKDRHLMLHGFETGRIVRLPGGEYVEVHSPLTPEERSRLNYENARLGPGMKPGGGRAAPTPLLRAALWRLLFEERLEPQEKIKTAEKSPSTADRQHDLDQ
ncbi:cytochrome bc1 complex cytochrome b subunit [Microbacterium forte]|uniref:cytochrome bc1 complex cytochrome b subunit n=1 Tax=Microbacterium forte TaxID=2982533 RepID=UPI002892DC6A|nr:cytochrome b N-terminal domain-containing protein [Microbacterium sp. A(2022)]